MRKVEEISVNGFSYIVVERGGYFKAAMNGYLGWTSVWADTLVNLGRRIKQLRPGSGQ